MLLFRVSLRGFLTKLMIYEHIYKSLILMTLVHFNAIAVQNSDDHELADFTACGTLVCFINFFRNLHYDSYKSSHLGTLRRD